MSYRSSQLYIKPETKARLRLVLKLFPQAKPANALPDASSVTADELGDTLINNAIVTEYPEVMEVEREIARVQQAAIDKMKERSTV